MRLIDADALIQSLEKKHAHWHELVPEENKEIEYAHQYAVNVIRNAPSAEPTGDLISREDAINAVAVAVLEDKDELEAIKALPSAVCDDCIWHVCNYNKVDWDAPTADAEPSLKAIKRQIEKHWYLDPPSAEAEWIPCSERLPDWKDMVEGVIITTENGRVTFADYSTENGTFHDVGQDVWASDIIAWMPLPTPYKGGDSE